MESHEWRLLERLQSGECTPDEVEAAQALLTTHPERAAFAAVLRALDPREEVKYTPNVAARYQQLQQRIRQQFPEAAYQRTLEHPSESRRSLVRGTPFVRTQFLWRWMGVGSLALVASFVLRTGWLRHTTEVKEQLYRTASGEQIHLHLADGTTMTLAPSTTAKVTAQRVDISGEAYFRVEPRKSRSFAVYTHNSVTHVLGTTFVVRQYPGDRESRVVVEDGKVMLQSRTQHSKVPTVLSERMVGRVGDSAITVTTERSVGGYTAWTRGHLVFRSTPLSSVLSDLARSYGVAIQVTDSTLADQPVTITVSPQTEPLINILDVVVQVAEAHYSRQGNTFVVAPGKSVSHDKPAQYRFQHTESSYGR